MEKDIILLASSKKHKHLCIAGIERNSGEWIRIISEDDSIVNAVRVEDTLYMNGTAPEIFDIVQVKIKAHKPNYYQPENYIFDNKQRWRRIGRSGIDEVLRIQKAGDKEANVFYDTEKRVHKGLFDKLSDKEKYSLILIEPNFVIIHVSEWPEKKKVDLSFSYKRRNYKFIGLTDVNFEQLYLKRSKGNYKLDYEVYLVLSLGECWENYHYKLVTTIIKK